MSIRLIIADTLKFKVVGTLADVNGPQPFDFSLIAKRYDADQLQKLLESTDETIADFMAQTITGWAGVKDESGEVPFSTDALRQLLKIPGLATLAMRTYLAECGAKAKN